MTENNCENLKTVLEKLHENPAVKVFSVELCPNRKIDVSNLTTINPLFYSVTWHSENTMKYDHDLHKIPAISLASKIIAQNKLVLLHLTCRYFSKRDIFDILTVAKEIGIKNILALQGDLVETIEYINESPDFSYAIDLVRFIREIFGDYFGIGVAGYPACDPESLLDLEIMFLKQKVDAGADFIITQAIFDAQIFETFYKKCRNFGISVPIIPGIFIITTYDGLTVMKNICKLKIPDNILNSLESIKYNYNEVRRFGLQHATNLINDLFINKDIPVQNVHIFSLNNISNVQSIVKELQL